MAERYVALPFSNATGVTLWRVKDRQNPDWVYPVAGMRHAAQNIAAKLNAESTPEGSE